MIFEEEKTVRGSPEGENMFDLNRIMQLGREAMVQEIQKQLQRYTESLLNDSLNPHFLVLLQKLLRDSGLDWTEILGLVGQKPGFDAYQVLGLDQKATDEQVKSRYRELLRKLHPDVAGVEGTGFLLQLVMAAYQTISKERGW